MTCTPADDDFLKTAWPGVVITTPEKWLVNVLSAQVGQYSVLLGGVGFVKDALLADTVSTIRNGLVESLGGQGLAAVSAQGTASFVLQEVAPGGLGVTVSGPSEGTIAAELIGGGDSNEAQRLFWLEQALCSLPPCCWFTCVSDYKLMHAALAAHWIYTMNSISSSGSGANDFTSMKLGPASLSKGKSAWSGNPTDGDFARTVPGQMYLFLRAKYVIPAVCA